MLSLAIASLGYLTPTSIRGDLPVSIFAAPLQLEAKVEGRDVMLSLKSENGELLEHYWAKDAKGAWREILCTPSDPRIAMNSNKREITGLRSSTSGGLFAQAPSLRFQTMEKSGSNALLLTSRGPGVVIQKQIAIPPTGNKIQVRVTADFEKRPRLEYFLDSYAFVPSGMPDSTFSPGLRTGDNQVVGDHFFRSPAISAQKGTLAAILMPNVDILANNRPMPTIVDLDFNSGVVNRGLMSFGFCDHRVVSHVAYAHDPSMTRKVPNHLELGFNLIVTATAVPFGAYQIASDESWKDVGHRTFDLILPQAMPFEEYARVCYPAAFAEKQGNNVLGWFEVELGGRPCGGVMAGWGYQQGWVSWQPWFNNLRSAWGMKWWGRKLGVLDWVEKADKMLNLALAAPLDHGLCPTTFQSREKTWRGCLITPRKDCYYDLTNMAWKGIWLLKWWDDPNCPRRDEVRAQCTEMAEAMVTLQNADGSFPTWLTKDRRVVPILDHSAQSALPVWFLAEMQVRTKTENKWTNAIRKGADFLVSHIVDQQLYYDFETFFSCSPKVCKQVDGAIDDRSMHDPHTLCPPQNTLSMHWTAEALRLAANLTRTENYLTYGLRALDMMNLYQNVWSISYRKTAYTFGGFGVQNSDGEFNDARQAQFGVTQCDFGAQLKRPDLFERGIAATRASETLINHPLHAEFGIYPNPNYPLGLQPENCCHGGGDHQAGRTGFDWGEGSGLTSMAELLDRYGSRYSVGGREVLVDGGSKGIEMLRASMPPPMVDPSFDFSDWRMPGWTITGDFAETPTDSTRYDFGVKGWFIGTCENGLGGFEDRYTGVITSPKFKVSKSKMSLLVGGGKGAGVYVELIDAATGKQIVVERGRDAEKMDRRVWDVSGQRDKLLQIRIVDSETGGWGHINVGSIRFE